MRKAKFSYHDFVYNLTSFLKDCVDYYSSQASYSNVINDKDGEMWNAGKAYAFEQVLYYLDDCSLLDSLDDPVRSGR